MIDRLAILVVYVVRDADDETLLALHLDRIARHTTVPYRIHAALPRVTDSARGALGGARGGDRLAHGPVARSRQP